MFIDELTIRNQKDDFYPNPKMTLLKDDFCPECNQKGIYQLDKKNFYCKNCNDQWEDK